MPIVVVNLLTVAVFVALYIVCLHTYPHTCAMHVLVYGVPQCVCTQVSCFKCKHPEDEMPTLVDNDSAPPAKGVQSGGKFRRE